MILILSNDEDGHADHVEALLHARGVDFVRFDPERFPREAEISIRYTPEGRNEYLLRTRDREVSLGRVRSVWYRRPGRPTPHPELDSSPAEPFIAEECSAFIQDLWEAVDCDWFPARPSVVRRAGRKASQLRIAGELGFRLPATLISNSRRDLLDFYRQHDGQLISKLSTSAIQNTLGNEVVRYTERVSPRDIAFAHDLRYCPVIFQAHVPKRFELRITVVGREVFAAEIWSQHTNHTRLDWRRYDFSNTPYVPHSLPAQVEAQCIALVEALGLRYGAIDMIVTPEGEYVFIEINPNGQYLWIEFETGLAISDAVCDVLIAGGLQVPGSEFELDQRGAL